MGPLKFKCAKYPEPQLRWGSVKSVRYRSVLYQCGICAISIRTSAAVIRKSYFIFRKVVPTLVRYLVRYRLRHLAQNRAISTDEWCDIFTVPSARACAVRNRTTPRAQSTLSYDIGYGIGYYIPRTNVGKIVRDLP